MCVGEYSEETSATETRREANRQTSAARREFWHNAICFLLLTQAEEGSNEKSFYAKNYGNSKDFPQIRQKPAE